MTRAIGERLPAVAVVLVLALAAPASAQTCAWGGVSAIAPPATTPLRAYRKLFHSPGRVAVDTAGQVYATDPRPGRVIVRDRYGQLSAVVDGFSTPLGIAVDASGRIYVGEQGTGRVLVFDQGWNFLGKLGAGDSEFVMPNDIAIDPDTGSIYVSDSGANEIRGYSSDWRFLRVFGARGTGPGQFRFPAGIYVGAGEVFVADEDNDRVQVFDQSGTFLRCFGRSGSMSFSKKFGRIHGLTGDSAGRIYVTDAFQGSVLVFDRGGALLGTVGSFGDGRGQLRTPMGLAIDPYNRLFVASANTGRIEVFGLDRFSDPQVIAAVVDVKPETLNRSSERRFITAYIELRDYRLEDVDARSITANGVAAAPSPVAVGDHDADGIPDLMVKFDAQAVMGTLTDGEATIVISGHAGDGTPFEGTDRVRVLSGGGRR